MKISQFEVRSRQKQILREGSIAVQGKVQGKGRDRSIGGAKEEVIMQPKRAMTGRAARVKVWEERIEEEEGEEERERRLREEVMVGRRGAGVAGGGGKMKTSGEIGVFDAERYFGAGAEQAGWTREEEEELLEEGEAGGDLPLSPLVEFGKAKVGQWRSAPENVPEVKGWAAPSFGRRRVESSEFTSPRTSTASSVSEVEPPHPAHEAAKLKSKSKSNKPQPASPSSRLASFLAKFKISADGKPPTPRKSPASSPILHLMSATTPPPSAVSPAKKFFSHALLLPPNGKPPSPRGRFLRAFSSSSAEHSSSGNSLRHHSAAAATPPSVAASSPVSPAGRSALDLYSPVAHSASTTPTSGRIPKSSPRSTNYEGTARSKPMASTGRRNTSSSSSGFKQLPFLSRKLKVYLMPEKAASDDQITKQDCSLTTSGNMPVKPPASRPTQRDLLRHHQQQQLPEVILPGSGNGAPHNGSARQSRMAEITKVLEEKERQRWLHAEDQVVDEDIELAERLLRVVQDHQSAVNQCKLKPNTNHQLNNNSMINRQLNYQHSNAYADRVSEYSSRKYNQLHPSTASLINVSSNTAPNSGLSSPGLGAAKQAIPAVQHLNMQKEESSLYDSDSSSDLFEIETLASVGMGLYRRDLPVYEAKEPSDQGSNGINNHFNLVSSRPSLPVTKQR